MLKSINVDGQIIPVSEDDNSLLETLEKAGVEVQAHCRNGYCGVCRVVKQRGEVDYHADPLAFIEDDEILPCSCKATGDIKITMKTSLTA